MRSIMVKLPDDIAARVEAEALLQRRDLAELAGEKLAERYAAAPMYTRPSAPSHKLQPLTALHLDTTWAKDADAPEDDSDAALLAEVRRFLGREME